jgi:hypothetical protein
LLIEEDFLKGRFAYHHIYATIKVDCLTLEASRLRKHLFVSHSAGSINELIEELCVKELTIELLVLRDLGFQVSLKIEHLFYTDLSRGF